MSTSEVVTADEERMLEHVMDALIVLSNVAQGALDAEIRVPQDVDAPIKAIFEGTNDMIRSLARETARTVDYQRELEDKIATIEKQKLAIAELSTPVMEVWDGVLCLPIVGVMDTARSAEMTTSLLEAVAEKGTRCCIIDLTGVEVMDTATADHFIRMARAVNLLGSECVLTGINPSMAQTIVQMGMDLASLRVHRTLQDALKGSIGKGPSGAA